MKLKIIIGIAILFLIIGVASATDINNLKCPDGWKAIGGGSYHEEGMSPGQGTGRNMMIQKYDDSFQEDFYTNNTEDSYYVYDNGDDTFNYTDGFGQDSGCFEVVEIDGVKYFVLFSTNDDYEFSSDTVTTLKLMEDFNQLNNLKPVAV